MQKRANFLFIDQTEDTYTIAMTPELQDDLGTVGYVDFPIGSGPIQAGEPLVNLEAAKSVIEIASPLSGHIIAINEAAVGTPSLLNSEKSSENWLVRLNQVDSAEFNALGDD